MKCIRCLKDIPRKEPLATLYVRPSTGMQYAIILCETCSIKFVDFIKELHKPEDAEEKLEE